MPRKPDGLVLSNWHTLFEDFSTSTQDFYIAVEEAIARRNLPEVEISRILFRERGIGSANREYLRVSRNRIAFDICSAPYGNGHFFSWWLAKIPAKYGLVTLLAAFVGYAFASAILVYPFRNMCFGGVFWSLLVAGPVAFAIGVSQGYVGDEEWVLSLPVVGYLYALVFNPITYYRFDSAMMFRDSIRAAVNEVINEVREEKGLRLLGDEELRPDAPKVGSQG